MIGMGQSQSGKHLASMRQRAAQATLKIQRAKAPQTLNAFFLPTLPSIR